MSVLWVLQYFKNRLFEIIQRKKVLGYQSSSWVLVHVFRKILYAYICSKLKKNFLQHFETQHW